MRIALCDWDKNFINYIKNIIYNYVEKSRIDIVVDCYTSVEKLLNSQTTYNIIFWGYKLYGLNGLEIAKELRNNNYKNTIIFLSEYTAFVFEAFKVNPYRFLTKPIKSKKLYNTLNEYFNNFGNDYPLFIKTGNDTLCLRTEEIFFIEANNKR